jgi:rare lipoprotein A (peptidoglycan hydrolase)
MNAILILAMLMGGGNAASHSSPHSIHHRGFPVVGTATWYRYHEGQAAAGPALRRALGAKWRGQRVTVCTLECVTVRLTDWCACHHGRVIDLDRRDFAKLDDPGFGVIPVMVTRPFGAALPATDTAP